MFTALFTAAMREKQPQCLLVDEWINRMWYIHVRKYHSALKKEGNHVTRFNMDEL